MYTYNIIAIGGTGMRCAESFVHLCAMGMFDETEVNLLALDTDYENGNFKRLESLIGAYNGIHPENKGALKDTLFSAKIRYYKFNPDYGVNDDFDNVSCYSSSNSKEHGDEVKWKESDLVDLSLTPEMRSMNLHHGYRAQTQMGSMLMYHAIVEEAYKYRVGANKNSGLCEFIENLMHMKGAKVFLFGSVFGGTGASSIPILPKALQKAAQIIKEGETDILTGNFYGTVMLTSYFQFGTPINQGDVVATSDQFAFNSQAALFFYNKDKTVRQTYKRLYLIGREKLRDLKSEKSTESVTGGQTQRNPVDYMELLAASAAYDFFMDARNQPKPDLDGEGEIFYRTIETDKDDNLTFKSFFGEKDGEKFAEKCGIMTACAFLIGPFGFAENIKKDYGSISDFASLYNYMKLYYDLKNEDKINPGSGWIKQMQESALADGYQGFLFDQDVYNVDYKKVKDFNIAENIFGKDSDYSREYKKKFSIGFLGNKSFTTFRDRYGKTELKDLDNTIEDLLKRIYSVFHELYGFA